MRPRNLLMAAVAALLCGAAPLTGRALGAPLPCLQLLGASSVKSVLGTDLRPVAIPVFTGESSCSWWAAEGQSVMVPFSLAFVDQRAFLNKIMFPRAAPSAAGVYNYEVWYRKEGGMKAEPLGAIGQHATAFAIDKGTVLLVLRADGVIRINSTLPREQLRALATRAANAPSPVLGRHVSFPEPGEIKEAVAHEPDPQMRNAPCVQMLNEAEVRTAKRTEVLVDAVRRPGYSLCEWRATSAHNTGFMVSVATASEFKAKGFSGASSYFAAEKKAMETTFKPEVLYGLGNDAIQAERFRQGVAMVRTGETVVTVTCFECNRFDAIVLARLAAVVK
jgi:hypothetical protein